MFYAIRHITRFYYSAPIYENLMEVRMQPRNDELQQCASFQLHIRPNARIFAHQDHLGNLIHQFDIPGVHTELTVRAEAMVRVTPPLALPAALEPEDWQRLDDMNVTQELWEMRAPSRFSEPTRALADLALELGVERRSDPLTVLRELNTAINRSFAYNPAATQVDSPIDEAIQQREGVCQDYAHIMLALVRNHLRIPGRYVSGYLYQRQTDRSAADATHAWVEVLLPDLGWVGFDPTNDLIAGERHVRVAIGRDYGDVPPTRGVFKGNADSSLDVSVHVRKAEDPELEEPLSTSVDLAQAQTGIQLASALDMAQQQQQQ
jgi:transglutaminase-like putative cysteine protease